MADSERKKMIQQGFDTVAAGYDHPALDFFPQTAKRMVAHLNLQGDESWLDVCTGTGCVALEAARTLAQGQVTGIDLSSGMLQQAERKAAEQKLSNVAFQQMDLDYLTFPPQSFDIVSSSFGLFFLDDMSRGLGHLVNSVKSGGRIAISTFTGEAFSPMSDLFVECYQSFGKDVQALSWKRLSTPELIEELFDSAGINHLSIHHEPLGYQMTDANMWWDVVWNAGYRSLLNQLSDEQQLAFKEKHMADIAQLMADDGIWFNTEVLIAIGEK